MFPSPVNCNELLSTDEEDLSFPPGTLYCYDVASLCLMEQGGNLFDVKYKPVIV